MKKANDIIRDKMNTTLNEQKQHLLCSLREIGIWERADIEPFIDEMKRQVWQAQLKQRSWLKLEENYSKHELGLRAVMEVDTYNDKGGDEWQINKALEKVGNISDKVSGKKSRKAKEILEKIASSGFYGYLVLRKKIGIPFEHPILKPWYAKLLPGIPNLINPGGVVQLKEGEFNLSAPISIKVSNISLQGVGFATKLIPASDINSIEVGVDTSVRFLIFRDFYLDHYTNDANTNGIYLNAAAGGVEVEDTVIQNIYCYYADQAIYGSYATRIYSLNNIIEYARYCGIHYHYIHYGVIIGNYMKDNSSKIWAAQVIADNVLVNVKGYPKILGCRWGSIIANNHLYNCTGYQAIQTHARLDATDTTLDLIANNLLFDCDCHGIYTHYAASQSKSIIIGNRIEEIGYHGIWVDASNCVIEGNVIINPSQYTTGYNGIHLSGSASNNFVINNFIYSDATQKPNYGICEETVDTATPNYNVYIGNYIEGVALAPTNILGENSLLKGNIGVLTIQTITADYTMIWADRTILADASSAPITVTLPDPASYPDEELSIKKIDSSTNAVTVAPHGSETIDGAASVSLANQWDSVTVKSDGTNWYVL